MCDYDSKKETAERDMSTDWYEIFGISEEQAQRAEEDMAKWNAARAEGGLSQWTKPNADPVQTVDYDEYGRAIRGIRSMQLMQLPLDTTWYAVDYSIENLNNIGDSEVLDVRKFADEYGMSSWSLQPVDEETFDRVEREFKKMMRVVSGDRSGDLLYRPHTVTF